MTFLNVEWSSPLVWADGAGSSAEQRVPGRRQGRAPVRGGRGGRGGASIRAPPLQAPTLQQHKSAGEDPAGSSGSTGTSMQARKSARSTSLCQWLPRPVSGRGHLGSLTCGWQGHCKGWCRPRGLLPARLQSAEYTLGKTKANKKR